MIRPRRSSGGLFHLKLTFVLVMAFVVFLGVGLFISGSFTPPKVNAFGPGRSATPYDYGYFYQKTDPCAVTSTCGTVIPGGLTATDISSFISEIQSNFQSSNPQLSIGSAYIIEDMLAQQPSSPPTYTSSAGQADFLKWQQIVSKYVTCPTSGTPQWCVNWNFDYNYAYNTYYQPSVGDVADFLETGTTPAAVFYDGQGNIIYAIRLSCGNPLFYNPNGIGTPTITLDGRKTDTNGNFTNSPPNNGDFNSATVTINSTAGGSGDSPNPTQDNPFSWTLAEGTTYTASAEQSGSDIGNWSLEGYTVCYTVGCSPGTFGSPGIDYTEHICDTQARDTGCNTLSIPSTALAVNIRWIYMLPPTPNVTISGTVYENGNPASGATVEGCTAAGNEDTDGASCTSQGSINTTGSGGNYQVTLPTGTGTDEYVRVTSGVNTTTYPIVNLSTDLAYTTAGTSGTVSFEYHLTNITNPANPSSSGWDFYFTNSSPPNVTISGTVYENGNPASGATVEGCTAAGNEDTDGASCTSQGSINTTGSGGNYQVTLPTGTGTDEYVRVTSGVNTTTYPIVNLSTDLAYTTAGTSGTVSFEYHLTNITNPANPSSSGWDFYFKSTPSVPMTGQVLENGKPAPQYAGNYPDVWACGMAPVKIACNDDSGAGRTGPLGNWSINDLVPGETYDVYVHSNVDTGTFGTLTLVAGYPTYTPASGLGGKDYGPIASATFNSNFPSTGGWDFNFTSPTSEVITGKVLENGSPSTTTPYPLVEACLGPGTGCTYQGSGQTGPLGNYSLTLTVGTQYYIRVISGVSATFTSLTLTTGYPVFGSGTSAQYHLNPAQVPVTANTPSLSNWDFKYTSTTTTEVITGKVLENGNPAPAPYPLVEACLGPGAGCTLQASGQTGPLGNYSLTLTVGTQYYVRVISGIGAIYTILALTPGYPTFGGGTSEQYHLNPAEVPPTATTPSLGTWDFKFSDILSGLCPTMPTDNRAYGLGAPTGAPVSGTAPSGFSGAPGATDTYPVYTIDAYTVTNVVDNNAQVAKGPGGSAGWSPTVKTASSGAPLPVTVYYDAWITSYPYDDHQVNINYTTYYSKYTETYKSATTPTYACLNGGSLSGSTCTTSGSKVGKTYKCPAGFSGGGGSPTCTRPANDEGYAWSLSSTSATTPDFTNIVNTDSNIAALWMDACYNRAFSISSFTGGNDYYSSGAVGTVNNEDPTEVYAGGSIATVSFSFPSGMAISASRVFEPMVVKMSYNETFQIKSVSGVYTPLSGCINTSGNFTVNDTTNPLGVGTGTWAVPESSCAVSIPGVLSPGDEVCVTYDVQPSGNFMEVDGTPEPDYNPLDNTGVGNNAPAEITTCSQPLVNKPYFKVFNSDVWSGGNFADLTGTCVSNIGSISANVDDTAPGIPSRGSSTQYAAAALGLITGFESADLRSTLPYSPDGLSFANIGSGTYGGNSDLQPYCIPDYFDNQPAGTVDESSGFEVAIPSVTGSQAIYVSGNAIIAGNVIYNDNGGAGWTTAQVLNPSGAGGLPSFFLVAKGNIFIDPSVTQMDGVYIAQGGSIYTCAVGDVAPSTADYAAMYDACGSQLNVTGALIADNIYLDRTFDSLRNSESGEVSASYSSGAGTDDCTLSGDGAGRPANYSCSAENFNFDPLNYLAAPAIPPRELANGGTFDYVTSLPPIL